MQEIIKKINDKLKPSGWYDYLRMFLESSDFADIIAELKRKREEENQRFCPALNAAFRFIEDIHYDHVKSVMLIDYACNRLDQANGIPLSTLDMFNDRTPTWIFQSVREEHKHTDLVYIDVNLWLRQGLLIAPLSLTSRIDGKPHKKIWSPFVMRLIEAVNKKHTKIPWLLVGQDTWKYEEDILSPHIRRMELQRDMEKGWNIWLNDILKSQKKAEIIW